LKRTIYMQAVSAEQAGFAVEPRKGHSPARY
jgi:hypothetical protein